jgi:hypothetical protein
VPGKPLFGRVSDFDVAVKNEGKILHSASRPPFRPYRRPDRHPPDR